mmetsp:Transcript_28446/g.92910  ORF Transcript_28446/g.92910 Transcript_28446/m.92910 type:complete len:226 (-) Transcript_28446:464-1141(-)
MAMSSASKASASDPLDAATALAADNKASSAVTPSRNACVSIARTGNASDTPKRSTKETHIRSLKRRARLASSSEPSLIAAASWIKSDTFKADVSARAAASHAGTRGGAPVSSSRTRRSSSSHINLSPASRLLKVPWLTSRALEKMIVLNVSRTHQLQSSSVSSCSHKSASSHSRRAVVGSRRATDTARLANRSKSSELYASATNACACGDVVLGEAPVGSAGVAR